MKCIVQPKVKLIILSSIAQRNIVYIYRINPLEVRACDEHIIIWSTKRDSSYTVKTLMSTCLN